MTSLTNGVDGHLFVGLIIIEYICLLINPETVMVNKWIQVYFKPYYTNIFKLMLMVL